MLRPPTPVRLEEKIEHLEAENAELWDRIDRLELAIFRVDTPVRVIDPHKEKAWIPPSQRTRDHP